MGSRAESEGEKPAAYCTLVTNDAYVTAALVLARSLRNTKTQHRFGVLAVTSTASSSSPSPSKAAALSAASIARLETLFDDVIPVSPIGAPPATAANLALIGRPDLHETLTKLHLWNLGERYSRVVYLDADTLVLRNLDHLLTPAGGDEDDGESVLPADVRFAASPELGFPDCFNAGMMYLVPDAETYKELRRFVETEASFDGGDQGLLNMFFGDGPRGLSLKGSGLPKTEINGNTNGSTTTTTTTTTTPTPTRNWFRLSYTYNMEMHAVYRMYVSAVLRYRAEHKVLHFIGREKPWHFEDGKVPAAEEEGASPYLKFYAEMVGRWWDVRREVGAI